MLVILGEPPSGPPPLRHDRRRVRGVFLGGWRLGRSEVEDQALLDAGMDGLVLNPPSALRSTSPLLVGGVLGGQVRWVVPLSPDRVWLDDAPEQAEDEPLRKAFSDFWDEVLYGLEGVHAAPEPVPIVDPGTRFGDMGIETGASGIPVHPMISMLTLETGLGLWLPLSRQQSRRTRYTSAFSEHDVIDTSTGKPLRGKRGLVEGKPGQAELSHFAALSGAGWVPTGAELAAEAVGAIADDFANVWARDLRGEGVWGRQLWACDRSLPANRLCARCREDVQP